MLSKRTQFWVGLVLTLLGVLAPIIYFIINQKLILEGALPICGASCFVFLLGITSAGGGLAIMSRAQDSQL